MPKQSDRKVLLNNLENAIIAKLSTRLLKGENCFENLTQNVPEVLLHYMVSKQRYLLPKSGVPKAPSKMNWLFQMLDNDRFRQELRMNRDSFFAILAMIQDDPIFAASDPRRPQTDVKVQMMVALECLGFCGNGVSKGRIARSAGVCGKLQK